jgi:hypothetical protein
MEPLRLDRIEHEDGITVVTTEIVVSDDDGSITITDMARLFHGYMEGHQAVRQIDLSVALRVPA